MKTLLIDNHDSFTGNLYQLLGEICGEAPVIVANDDPEGPSLLRQSWDGIVLSPGPGRPDRPGDFGICSLALRLTTVPILGVCLGHQGMALAEGGFLIHAPQPMHGRISEIHHDGQDLFRGLSQPFPAVRYHSLIVPPPLPASLLCTAWTEDGLVMGLRHRHRPWWGVQFHPESIGTPEGRRILQNFRDLAVGTSRSRAPSFSPSHRPSPPPSLPSPSGPPLRLHTRLLPFPVSTASAFSSLYGDSPWAFWLDSSDLRPGLSRFSFMGAPGPYGKRLSYDAQLQRLKIEEDGKSAIWNGDLLHYLEAERQRFLPSSPPLPFDFHGGFVGYLGYEMRAAWGYPVQHPSSLPDAMGVWADRIIAFDHQNDQVYLLCLCPADHEEEAIDWMETTTERLRSLAPLPSPPPAVDPSAAGASFFLVRSPNTYGEDVRRCLALIGDGESYEMCLTNRLVTESRPDPLGLYLRLRAENPSPFAAFLRFPEVGVACSSPERFLKVHPSGWVEARPIKGTRPRGLTPEEDESLRRQLAESEKDRAENLMIVDLLRNDLGTVCRLGSVEVPRSMEVETYASVHQLVSTITGWLENPARPTDAIRAAFPGGSMTGAPKQRAMKLLEEIEGRPREIYSGALGYLSLNGALDLNIVIRTAVLTGEGTSIGCGGAVVALSTPEGEYEEMRLKAERVMRAIRSSR